MQNLTLVVLAAGMGSRYGGQLKQMDTFGPNGEALLEYSIYDAMRAGFTKVIFVIRRDFEEEFKHLIGDKFRGKIEVEYAFQELTDLPHGFALPVERQKPRGTAHAVLCATTFIQEPFAVINADDFYGKESYHVLADFLSHPDNFDKCCIVGYTLSEVLSDHGTVSRGICEVDINGYLLKVVENKKIYKAKDLLLSEQPDGGEKELAPTALCSMNMMGFTPKIIHFYENYFRDFLLSNINDPKAEFYMPEVISRWIQEEGGVVAVLPTTSQWFGVTYQEDKQATQQQIKKLIEAGEYPEKLWE